MWHSEKDIINDLAILNDFGEPGGTEPYKVLCSVGRGSKAKKKLQSEITVDPRTGEEVEVGDPCLNLEEIFYKGRGRGALLGSRSYTLLQKQLRLARPLGSSDDIIESYCRRNKRQSKDSNEFHNLKSKNNLTVSSTSSEMVNSNASKPRIKAVRNSNKFNNALISGLLKNRNLSSLSLKTNFDDENKNCTYKNGHAEKSCTSQGDSLSDDLNSSNASEDTTLESLYNFSINDIKEKSLSKLKLLKNEGWKTCSSDSDEDCNGDVKLTETTEEDVRDLKNEDESGNAACCQNIAKALQRDEVCRKLSEKLKKTRLLNGQEENEKEFLSLRHGTKKCCLNFQESVDFNSKLVRSELNFPPVVNGDMVAKFPTRKI